MKFSSLLILVFLLTNQIYSQSIISRLDIAHKDLSRDQLSIAATVIKAIELDKFELIHSYKNETLTKDDHKSISNLIKSNNINSEGFPPLVQESNKNLKEKYSRAYYKFGSANKEILFIVKLKFKGTSNKVNSIVLITINKNEEEGLFFSHINKIVCGNRPVGPPAFKSLIDFDTGKKKRLYQRLAFRKDNISEIQKIHQYKEYNLSLTFIGIPKEYFDTTSIWDLNIESLKISEREGELTSINPRIGNLKQLKILELDLQNTKIPLEIFDLVELKELKIYSENKIDLDTALANINNLKKLKNLTINNDLNSIPIEICSLKNLEKLNFTSNSLTSIPKEIGDLKNLTSLKISGSYIEIPDEIGKLENLRSLFLSSQNLKKLPNSIGNLINLSSLWISKTTKLDSLPKEISQIKKIDHLNFNDVAKLPKLKASISNISKLYIYYAKDLSGIEDYLGETRKLRLLGCSIDTLPNIFDYSFNLADIAIDDCTNLKHIKKSTNIPQKLRSVKIGNTKLEQIPIGILLSTNLKHLSFQDSKLKKIPLEISNLSYLKELRLIGNRIEEIPIELFNLKDCRKVYLNNNKIVEISSEVANIQSNRNLTVYLYGNPINPTLELNNSLFKYKY